MNVRYEVNALPLPEAATVLELLSPAGTSFPNWSPERMARALNGSAVVVCAWEGPSLVGFARVVSDLAWCAYLSQLAVRPGYQRRGIGKKLLAAVLEQLGEEVSLLVHSADGATSFYTSNGFEPYSNVYRSKRKK